MAIDSPLSKFHKVQPKSLSDREIDERAAEASVLLQNKVFLEALDEVYSRTMGTLLDADVGSLTASTAHATLKGLEKLRSQLEQYVSDRKMRQKYPTKGEQDGR